LQHRYASACVLFEAVNVALRRCFLDLEPQRL
jgi:hypothetical protein